MKDKFRSYTITKGVARSPNRSMLRAIGYQDADFEKPIVGIANGHSTMNPCNAGIQPLADAADAAIRAAGGMPQMFGTITVTDGISMGTEGMKYSLVSREVIADSIETDCQSQFMDGVVAIGACDKNLPGALIGVCGMNTANTMSSACEAIGMSLPFSSTMAAEDEEKKESAAESARVLLDAVKAGLKPRDIITRKSLENAIAVIMAVGGSTNAVLHFL